MSILAKLFITIVPFIYVMASCYMTLRKDSTGAILFGLGGMFTSAFASLVLFITIPQVHKRIEFRIVLVLIAISVGLAAWAIINSA
jgi:hypothetical protein